MFSVSKSFLETSNRKQSKALLDGKNRTDVLDLCSFRVADTLPAFWLETLSCNKCMPQRSVFGLLVWNSLKGIPVFFLFIYLFCLKKNKTTTNKKKNLLVL